MIPIRGLSGMTRLSSVLSETDRSALGTALADRTIRAVHRAGLDCMVVTSDPSVSQWATKRCRVAQDEGDGLSEVVSNAVNHGAQPHWMVLHADLPLVDAASILRVHDAATRHGAAIVPSIDGGTNAIAGTGEFHFAYGPGSFHAHLASRASARVLSLKNLALEVDTEAHYSALTALGFLPSLTS